MLSTNRKANKWYRSKAGKIGVGAENQVRTRAVSRKGSTAPSFPKGLVRK